MLIGLINGIKPNFTIVMSHVHAGVPYKINDHDLQLDGSLTLLYLVLLRIKLSSGSCCVDFNANKVVIGHFFELKYRTDVF